MLFLLVLVSSEVKIWVKKRRAITIAPLRFDDCKFLRTYDSTLIPVPTNESLKDEPGELEISSESLKEWINKVTIWQET